MIPKRICIYPKDVQIITGRSERYSGKLISDIKKHLNKETHQLVTVEEFSKYMGIKSDDVTAAIIG